MYAYIHDDFLLLLLPPLTPTPETGDAALTAGARGGELLLDHRWCSKHVQNVFSYYRMCSPTTRIRRASVGSPLV